MDGEAVGGACLAAVPEEKENTSTSLWERCVDGAGVGGTRLAAVLEENERAPAPALGAVRGWCRSRRHSPGGSAGEKAGLGRLVGEANGVVGWSRDW